MPQLDVAAFLTNFFWFFLVFASLYVLVLKVFLPRLAKAFVFRSELVSHTLESSVYAKLQLDYCGSSFQFLESALTFSLLEFCLVSFRDSVQFQSDYLLSDITSLLELENSLEVSSDLDF